jgi:hypothetical protein
VADAEFLLTVNGTDITDLIWSWSSVTITDSFSENATLSFTTRQPLGATPVAPAYADVRLVNLLTSTVLFEGVVGTGPQPRNSVDPGWIDTTVSCVDYEWLLDLCPVQLAIPSDPDSSARIAAILRAALTDYRVRPSVRTYHHPGASASSWLTNPLTTDIAQFTPARQAIEEILSRSVASELDGGGPYSDGFHNRGHVLKWASGMGWVIAPPSRAFRGTAPVTLTAASFGRPSVVQKTTDTSRLSSAVVVTELDGSSTHLVADASRATTTNGYLVGSATYTLASSFYAPNTSDAIAWADYAEGGAASSEFYTLTAPNMPHDVQVGHEITVEDVAFGSVTGIVQSVSSTFRDGVFDTASVARPYFLNSGLNLDGTWNLDASVASTTPRRTRVSTIRVAGESRSFLRALRASKSF